jgi:hypothetical protein
MNKHSPKLTRPTKRIMGWADLHEKGGGTFVIDTEPLVRIGGAPYAALRGLMVYNIYCASPVRLSAHVMSLRKHGVRIETLHRKAGTNRDEVGSKWYGVYVLKSDVRMLPRGEKGAAL